MESQHEKEMSAEESLRLITEMILATRRHLQRDGFMFLLWGWLVFAAGILEFILKTLLHSEYFWIGWPALICIGMAGTILHRRRNPRSVARTHLGNRFPHYSY